MKGRLLPNQLDNNDKLFKALLMECFQEISAKSMESALITDLINKLNINSVGILPCQDHTETYPSLLKALEVLMYIEENKALLEALPEKNPIKITVLSVQEKIVTLLSAIVQSKKYPSRITEFDYDLILINYSDQAVLRETVNIDQVREFYTQFNQCPVLLKCGNQILCYGIVDEIINEKCVSIETITVLDPTKLVNLPFPEEKNSPYFLAKNHTSEEMQEEVSKAHAVYLDYIYDKEVNYHLTKRTMVFSDNVSEMLLLAFLRMIDSLPLVEKNKYHIQHILQLIRNSRHIWLDSKDMDTTYALHKRKSQGGTVYESTNNKKSWRGLIKILNYVFKNSEVRHSEIGKLFTTYLQSLRVENTSFLNELILSQTIYDDKKIKNAKKGVIQNKNGIYSINQFQILPDKKVTPQTEASILMKELLEDLLDNLHLYRHKIDSIYQPKVEYVIELDNKKECIMYFPVVNKNNKKEITYKKYNLTKLLKNQPLLHEISLSPEYCRYALTAMVGCHLYISFSSNKETIKKQIKKHKILPNSCIIICEVQHKKAERNVKVNQLYYVTFDKKIEPLDAENNTSNTPKHNEHSVFTEIAKRIHDSEWIKDNLPETNNSHPLIYVDSSKKKWGD